MAVITSENSFEAQQRERTETGVCLRVLEGENDLNKKTRTLFHMPVMQSSQNYSQCGD